MTEASTASLWLGALSVRDRELLACMARLEHPHRMSPMGGNPVADRTSCNKLVDLGLAERQLEGIYGRWTYRATFYGRRVHAMLKEGT